MPYAALADGVVAVHLAFVGFVLLGQVAILVGWALRWSWVRGPLFRLTHLASILLVAGEAVLGVPCPLTVLEDHLRIRAGQTPDEISFIGRLMRDVLFLEGIPPETFRNAYVAFAALALLTFVACPPRFRRH